MSEHVDRLELLQSLDVTPIRAEAPLPSDLSPRAQAVAASLESDLGGPDFYEVLADWGNAETLGFGEFPPGLGEFPPGLGEFPPGLDAGVWWFEIDDPSVFDADLREATEVHDVSDARIAVTVRRDGVHLAFYEGGVYVQFMISTIPGEALGAAEGASIASWMLSRTSGLVKAFR